MAIIEAGTGIKTAQDYVDEIYSLVGEVFTIKEIVVLDGKIVKFTADTEWKTGGTTTVETGEFVKIQVESEDLDEEGNPIIVEVDSDIPEYDYVEDYEQHELTPEQIVILNTWIAQNIEG